MVIVVVPAPTAVTKPLASTEAIESSSDDHVTAFEAPTGLTVASNCNVSLIFNVWLVSFKEMLVGSTSPIGL